MGRADKGTDEAYAGHGLYAGTPSQAEGERDPAGERTRPDEAAHRMVPRDQPSQAEGERTD
ncbi:hypothetical protein [uncultured Streptomyces sp.]|uniref:hypothetical protein n=1 Tax=uncultured Streptomyces sp. TaxID=174707 RepID=UPI00260E5B4A|nr:hypothetical protein [uncultured Streptomyces sp.]